MNKRILAGLVGILVSTVVTAAPANWSFANRDSQGTSFVDVNSLSFANGAKSIQFLRNYDKSINLGVDPVTSIEWYPHQSVAITYEVDCTNNKFAMRSWKLYSGVDATGEVVWADKDHGYPAYTNATTDEEIAVLGAACGETVALQSSRGPLKTRM